MSFDKGNVGSVIKKNKKIIMLCVVLVLLIYYNPFSMQTAEPGFLTGTQGLEPRFDSVYFENEWWSQTESSQLSGRGPPSSLSFGYSMNFDPDNSQDWMPNLCASQQPITVDIDVEPKSYVWDYKVETGKALDNGTIVDVYKRFEMFKYRCSWSINVWLAGPEAESGFRSIFIYQPNYGDTKIWLKLVPRSFVYFTENPEQLFFAPAYIGLSQTVEWSGIDKDGKETLNDPEMISSQDLIPKAKGETVGIYYERGGADVFTEETLLQFQGTTLDPQVFREAYWMRVDLLNFEPLRWSDIFGHRWKYPSAHLDFMVDLFVCGEWKIQIKTGEIPELEPHTPIVHMGMPWDWLTGWFSSPWNQIWTLLFLAVIVIILVSVFNPGLVTALAMRRRKET